MGSLFCKWIAIPGSLRLALLRRPPDRRTAGPPLNELGLASTEAYRDKLQSYASPITAMKLEDIVPWARSGDEYAEMFELEPATLAGSRLLSFGDGPSDFNLWARRRFRSVVSMDPIYGFDAMAIARQIDAVQPSIEKGLRDNPDNYLWERFRDPDALIHERRATMQRFLDDFSNTSGATYYRAGRLPEVSDLPEADLGLCSHLLFLYSEQLDLAAHRHWILAMMSRVRELRIYPLIDLSGAPSAHVAPILSWLPSVGLRGALVPCRYRFQRGADHFMRISASTASTASTA